MQSKHSYLLLPVDCFGKATITDIYSRNAGQHTQTEKDIDPFW